MLKEEFPSVDPTQAADDFERLYERVSGFLQRVHIARGGERGCVLISLEELDSLEHAIEVLSDSTDVRELARSLSRVAHATAAFATSPVGA
ncbi:MAG TPA: hypothetical protein VMD30_13510 [Tepidisphaeraceae bacterium]|nr:hypothetical protein [Tepidisphaeraceae bacterium]